MPTDRADDFAYMIRRYYKTRELAQFLRDRPNCGVEQHQLAALEARVPVERQQFLAGFHTSERAAADRLLIEFVMARDAAASVRDMAARSWWPPATRRFRNEETTLHKRIEALYAQLEHLWLPGTEGLADVRSWTVAVRQSWRASTRAQRQNARRQAAARTASQEPSV